MSHLQGIQKMNDEYKKYFYLTSFLNEAEIADYLGPLMATPTKIHYLLSKL